VEEEKKYCLKTTNKTYDISLHSLSPEETFPANHGCRGRGSEIHYLLLHPPLLASLEVPIPLEFTLALTMSSLEAFYLLFYTLM